MTLDPFKTAGRLAKQLESLRPIEVRPAIERASDVYQELRDAFPNRVLTEDRYFCPECKHRGPAVGRLVKDYHGDGAAEETIQDTECERCGGNQIEPINGE